MKISVDPSCCAGVTPKTHEAALETIGDVPDKYFRLNIDLTMAVHICLWTAFFFLTDDILYTKHN